MRQIDAEPTGGPVVGLRVAIGAGLLAIGWLVLGAVAGGASAAELEIGDGSLLGPDSSLAVVTETIHDVGMEAGPSAAPSGADDAPGVAGLSVLSEVADVADVQKVAEPVLESVEPALETVEPVLETVEPVLESVEPVLKTVEPVLKTVERVAEPVLETVEPVLDVVEPMLEPVGPVPETVGVEASAVGTRPESIQIPQQARTDVQGDFQSTHRSAAGVLADPTRHAPDSPAPVAPLIPTETVAPGGSGSLALPSVIAEQGWASCAPSAHTKPPGNDIPPTAPASDSDSTPD